MSPQSLLYTPTHLHSAPVRRHEAMPRGERRERSLVAWALFGTLAALLVLVLAI